MRERKHVPGFNDKVIFADRVNNAIGSGPFILCQTIFLALYVFFQIHAPDAWAFDRYPFILLNLILSFQAGYTGPFVIWSNNRAAKRLELVITYIRDVVTKLEHLVSSQLKHEKKMEKEITELKQQNLEMAQQISRIETLLLEQKGA